MATKKPHPCETLAKGGVGESGATALLYHQLVGGAPRLMVLRTTDSSLCPNTGAVAAIVVNGVPEAYADITTIGSTIQAEAGPGDFVVAVVHTIPLFNEIHCVRLGELEVGLESCDLVGFTAGLTTKLACHLPCHGVKTRDWYAWNNKMPPKPDDFHVVGEVEVPNPGVDVELVRRIPPGLNPKILLMDLVLTQRAGIWPQKLTWKPIRYEKVVACSDFELVEIFCGEEAVAKVKVENIH